MLDIHQDFEHREDTLNDLLVHVMIVDVCRFLRMPHGDTGNLERVIRKEISSDVKRFGKSFNSSLIKKL